MSKTIKKSNEVASYEVLEASNMELESGKQSTSEVSTPIQEIHWKTLETIPEHYKKWINKDLKPKISIRYGHNSEYLKFIDKLGYLHKLQEKVNELCKEKGFEVRLLNQFWNRVPKIHDKISKSQYNRYRKIFLKTRKYNERKKYRKHEGQKIDISMDGMKGCKNLSNNSYKNLDKTKNGYKVNETLNFIYENYNEYHSSETKENIRKEFKEINKNWELKNKNILTDYSGTMRAIYKELEKEYGCTIFFSKNSQNSAKLEKEHEYIRTVITEKTNKKETKDLIIQKNELKERLEYLKQYNNIDKFFINF